MKDGKRRTEGRNKRGRKEGEGGKEEEARGMNRAEGDKREIGSVEGE